MQPYQYKHAWPRSTEQMGLCATKTGVLFNESLQGSTSKLTLQRLGLPYSRAMVQIHGWGWVNSVPVLGVQRLSGRSLPLHVLVLAQEANREDAVDRG